MTRPDEPRDWDAMTRQADTPAGERFADHYLRGGLSVSGIRPLTTREGVTVTDDICTTHTEAEGLSCGDCALVNERYLAQNVPTCLPDRAHYTVADAEQWMTIRAAQDGAR
jgi:hypothetical protein